MIFKNGVTNEPVLAADFDMVSTDNKRIVLKYNGKLWDDVLFEAMRMACEVINNPAMDMDSFEKVVADISMCVGFSIQLASIRTYADISVTTTSGSVAKKRFLVYGETEEVVNILTRFFSEGCQGVLPSFADHFAAFFVTWRSSEKNKNYFANSY